MFLYDSKKIEEKERQNLYLKTIYRSHVGSNDILGIALIAVGIAAIVLSGGSLAQIAFGLGLIAAGLFLLTYKPPEHKSNNDERQFPIYSGFDVDPQLRGFGASIPIIFGIAKVGNIIIDKRIFGDNNALGLWQGIICDSFAFQTIVAVYNREKAISHILQRILNQIPPDIQNSFVEYSEIELIDSNINKTVNYLNGEQNLFYNLGELVQNSFSNPSGYSGSLDKNKIVQILSLSSPIVNLDDNIYYPLIGYNQKFNKMVLHEYSESMKEYIKTLVNVGLSYKDEYLDYYNYTGNALEVNLDRPINNSQDILLNINYWKNPTNIKVRYTPPKYAFFYDYGALEKLVITKTKIYRVEPGLASAMNTDIDKVRLLKENDKYIPVKIVNIYEEDYGYNLCFGNCTVKKYIIQYFDKPEIILRQLYLKYSISDLPPDDLVEFKLQGLNTTIAGGTHGQEISTSKIPLYYKNGSRKSEIKLALTWGKGIQNFDGKLYIKGLNRNYWKEFISFKGREIYNKSNCEGGCSPPPGKMYWNLLL